MTAHAFHHVINGSSISSKFLKLPAAPSTNWAYLTIRLKKCINNEAVLEAERRKMKEIRSRVLYDLSRAHPDYIPLLQVQHVPFRALQCIALHLTGLKLVYCRLKLSPLSRIVLYSARLHVKPCCMMDKTLAVTLE